MPKDDREEHVYREKTADRQDREERKKIGAGGNESQKNAGEEIVRYCKRREKTALLRGKKRRPRAAGSKGQPKPEDLTSSPPTSLTLARSTLATTLF
jgi:hypothetical protein